VTFFFFVYVGAETGYAGWVPTYSIITHVTANRSKAAYLSAIFWGALTLGRILAVPAAIYFSATTMIRIQLFMIVVAVLASAMFFRISYPVACWICGFIGFALSSIFPVMMTLFSDYGFEM
jgi:fucose permease